MAARILPCLAQFEVEQTTELLRRLAGGDAQAQGPLYAAVHAELRRLAGGMMKEQRAGHTLQPTALVHEAWIRMVAGGERSYHNRGHFLCVASKAMRSVLVDHVRARRASKRGSDPAPDDLDAAVACLEAGEMDLLDLEQALEELERHDRELARMVELRFFGGLSHPDLSSVLGVSLSTVERHWRVARAFLRGRMSLGREVGDELA